MTMIGVQNLSIRIEGRPILRDVSLRAGKGEFIGLIGPNGSGKSTLLRAMARLLPPSSGGLWIAGKPLKDYSYKELARAVGYVPQDTSVDFDFSVRDIVLMGRYPYMSRFGAETRHDREIVRQAMLKTATLHLADRVVTSLSGGQRQMVLIAKALAQEPQVLLLDEPISALDLRYQLHVLELMRNLARQGRTVIAALHDLNLAARFCHRLVLLANGEVNGSGTPEEVLTPETIERAYDVRAIVRIDPWFGSPCLTAISGNVDSSGPKERSTINQHLQER